MTLNELIEKHALRAGVDPKEMRRTMAIESSGNANARSGSYKGLFQLSDREFKAHGGSGNIYDPEQNIMAAANKMAQDKREFRAKYDRDPTPLDTYMVHQQGAAGYNAHMANPSGTAWENIRPYYANDAIAKEAIWNNLPASEKARKGSVDNVTSEDFVRSWADKVGGDAPDFSSEMSAKAQAYKRSMPGRSGTEDEFKADFLEGKDTAQTGKIPNFFSNIPEPEMASLQVPQLTPRFSI